MELIMTSRDYFIVGCKVLGVYCIFLSLEYFVHALSTFFTVYTFPSNMATNLFLAKMVLRLIPIIYVVLGIYLLKDGQWIHNLAYPVAEPENGEEDEWDQDDDSDVEKVKPHDDKEYTDGISMSDKISLAFKFAGIYLILVNFPQVLARIEFYAVRMASTSYGSGTPESIMFDKIFTHLYAFPSVCGMLLGIYLLSPNNVFIRVALKVPGKANVKGEGD